MIRDYVYVGDVVKANLLALEIGEGMHLILELALKPKPEIYIGKLLTS